MRVRLIVPRRADRGARDRLWAFCRAYWAEQRPGWEIVEGHHDDGPFNRSAAINRAAEGKWDVAVILDSDTVLDVDQVEAGAAHAVRSGHLVLPFTDRCLLNKVGTARILAGVVGSWDRWVTARQTPADSYVYISGCQIVPRALWDEVGGFDYRFEGWGGEDDAFHAACTALTGHDARDERLPGSAWHLWHRRSPYANHRRPTWRMAKALSDRYIATKAPHAMRSLIGESREPDQIVVCVLTTGKRKTLDKTLASAEARLSGPIGRRLICVDGNATVKRDGWDVVKSGRASRGYAPAVRAAIEHALGSGQAWVFWLEDDFTFNRPVDLRAMQALIDGEDLVQLSLKRQPWYPHEVEAGGVIEAKPEAFTQREGYVAHRDYFSMNPMLCRRSTLAEHHWPNKPDSERLFGLSVYKDRKRFAGILGQLTDPPLVTHIGTTQAGRGY